MGLINGGYYNEDGGYYVPVWARGFISAEGTQGQINAEAYCDSIGMGAGRIRAVRYTPAKNGHRYESSWSYIDNEWVESNYTYPNQAGMYAAYAICCGICSPELTDEEYINSPFTEDECGDDDGNGTYVRVTPINLIYKKWDGNTFYESFYKNNFRFYKRACYKVV